MRRDGLLVVASLLAGTAVGCRFQKATEGEINPPDDPDPTVDGGPIELPPVDVNIMPMPDAQLFESGANQNCIEANPQTMVVPPDVLIVLDRSGSMLQDINGNTCQTGGAGGRTGGAGGRNGGGGNPMGGLGDCGANSKWTQMTMALKELLPTVETSVNWGLKYFADGSNNSECTVNAGVAVAPKTMNAMAISMSIDGTRPATATPTAAAMKSAATYLAALDDGSPKFILLATDGIPTCGGAQMGGATPDDANAIDAVKAAKAMNIPTFVIGIGTGMGGGDATLSTMATEGGFPRATTPTYYPVNSASDLKDAFAKISSVVGACFFKVTPVPKSSKDIMDVKGDGNVIPEDGTDGWSFITMGNSSGVQLNGKSCDDYKSGAIKSVVADLPCIIP